MRKLSLVLAILGWSLVAVAQESMEKVMEKRAREMHRVIGLSDKQQWKKFIQENYTQALIDRPMKARVAGESAGHAGSPTSTPGDNLEAKANMFQRLHDDFGDSKITSLNPSGEDLEMKVESGNGLHGTFRLKFDKKKPYLIDLVGIEAGH